MLLEVEYKRFAFIETYAVRRGKRRIRGDALKEDCPKKKEVSIHSETIRGTLMVRFS